MSSTSARLLQGRIERFCTHYHGAPMHAALCDPPYELGMMSKSWDSTGVSFRPDTWSAIASLLYPGAFIMAFAGTRTYHRMAVAMEDAGLIIQPPIGWLTNQGFPKATQLSSQIDRDAGVERETGEYPGTPSGFIRHGRTDEEVFMGTDGNRSNQISLPTTDLAKVWAGHRYGGQVLKPAFEFIAVAQVPYPRGMRKVDSIAQTGAGALNIEAGRIPTDDTSRRLYGGSKGNGGVYGDSAMYDYEMNQGGRWPANFTLDTEAGEWLDQQTGDLGVSSGGTPKDIDSMFFGKTDVMGQNAGGLGDSGGASRFYHTYDWQAELSERLENADSIRYQPKASRSEREAGLRHHTSQTVNDGRDTPIDNPYQRGETLRKNTHPTQKPIGLTEWLAKLLLPPKAYTPRRILVPFAGTGSEMIGAYRAGWDCIIGVEMTAEYVEIGRARLDHWLRQGVQLDMFDSP